MRRNKLKLFVWLDNIKTLAQYGDGTVFALATDKETAIEMVVNEYYKYRKENPEYTDEINSLLSELATTKPLVFQNPVAFFIMGSA